MDDEPLWTFDEAVERLRCTKHFLKRALAEERVEHVRLGRRVLIPDSALAALLQAHRAPSDPAALWAPPSPPRARSGARKGSSIVRRRRRT